jgi:hypothetical protein
MEELLPPPRKPGEAAEGLQVRDYNFHLHFLSSPFSLNNVFRRHQ